MGRALHRASADASSAFRPPCFLLVLDDFMKQNSALGRASDTYQFFGGLRRTNAYAPMASTVAGPLALCFGWLRIFCLSNRVGHPNRLLLLLSDFFR